MLVTDPNDRFSSKQLFNIMMKSTLEMNNDEQSSKGNCYLIQIILIISYYVNYN